MNTPNKKVGRPRAYTPEALDAKFEEYVEWVKANPVSGRICHKRECFV